MIKVVKVNVKNMVCTSCEKLIEDELNIVSGIVEVSAEYESGVVKVKFDDEKVNERYIFNKLKRLGYEVKNEGEENENEWFYIVGIIIIGLLILRLGGNSGAFNISEELSSGVTYVGLFVIGIFTSLHCIGMCGGIALSQSITIQGREPKNKLKPSILYNVGRLISYTVLGGAVGAIGAVFSLSIKMQAVITLVAGVFMVLWGFNTFGFKSFRKFSLRLKKKEGKESKSPFIVGLLNGFMPCGPLQAMQLYALATGSLVTGALSMFFFALGTMPLMLLFSLVANMLSRKNSRRLVMASGLLVVFLGISMTMRGLNLVGINMGSIKDVFAGESADDKNIPVGSKAVLKEGKQVITIVASEKGYSPRNVYVEKGVPTEIIFKGESLNSCNNEIIIPSLNIRKKLSRGETSVEFTPDGKDINYSCWMGMITGRIKVVDSLDTLVEDNTIKEEETQTSSCCATGGSSEPTFYGKPISEVETNKLVKVANLDGNKNSQSLNITSDSGNFEPAIIVLREDIPFNMNINVSDKRALDGEYKVVDIATGESLASLKVKDGKGELSNKALKSGVYGIFKGNDLYMIIESVKGDVKNTDLEEIRRRYF